MQKGKILKDGFNRKWIIENTVNIIKEYEEGELTIRGLHYRLVSLGMTNTTRHYKRVCAAMAAARRDGTIPYSFFADHERQMVLNTEYTETTVYGESESSKHTIKYWMNNYWKNRWENQDYFIEVWIEKKSLQGIFEKACRKYDVGLFPCKGYPSLTHLYKAKQRFEDVINETGKEVKILYFGDYDPSGEDIPRSLKDNISELGLEINVEVISLNESQVVKWKLPPAPVKPGDTRSVKWNGLGQVELDAVEPKKLQRLATEAIEKYFDKEKYIELMNTQEEEKAEYVAILKEYVNGL